MFNVNDFKNFNFCRNLISIDDVDWNRICVFEVLTESFIEKYKDYVDWGEISQYQKLSESFIEKYKDKVNWFEIMSHQQLSEVFIEKHKDMLNMTWISKHQKLSKFYIEKHLSNIQKEIQLSTHHDTRTKNEKRQEMRVYAEKHGLKFENDILYTYRRHNKKNQEMFSGGFIYNEIGKKYKNWRCDLDSYTQKSFGFYVIPNGNIKVAVHIDDWGCIINKSNDVRVFAFTLLEMN